MPPQPLRPGSRLVVVSVLAVLLLASCGAGAAASLTTMSQSAVPPSSVVSGVLAPPPSTSGATRGGPALTNADDGKLVHYQVGETFALSLKAPVGYQNYAVAPLDLRILVPVVNPAAAAARGVTLRSFKVVGTGRTMLTATSAPACVAGQACSGQSLTFQVTIISG